MNINASRIGFRFCTFVSAPFIFDRAETRHLLLRTVRCFDRGHREAEGPCKSEGRNSTFGKYLVDYTYRTVMNYASNWLRFPSCSLRHLLLIISIVSMKSKVARLQFQRSIGGLPSVIIADYSVEQFDNCDPMENLGWLLHAFASKLKNLRSLRFLLIFLIVWMKSKVARLQFRRFIGGLAGVIITNFSSARA